ncbi:MAG TPA: MauE/DoxX family redox-associated membrane protein [Candidatus Acidoferrales bacterium]|nr:MauE/DoxX family redox-associated membrane protein [Candidatus Acidoferrales bacterium]
MTSSSRWSAGRTLLLIGRLALAVVFLAAAYGKLRPQSAVPWTLASLKITPASLGLSMTFFAMQVDSYQLLPPRAVSPFAHTLPWVEFAVGVLLLTGLALRYVSLASALLLALFYGVVIRSYALHLAINCGCFGPNEKLDAWTLVRDGCLFALGVAVTIAAFIVHRRNRPALAASPHCEHAT